MKTIHQRVFAIQKTKNGGLLPPIDDGNYESFLAFPTAKEAAECLREHVKKGYGRNGDYEVVEFWPDNFHEITGSYLGDDATNYKTWLDEAAMFAMSGILASKPLSMVEEIRRTEICNAVADAYEAAALMLETKRHREGKVN